MHHLVAEMCKHVHISVTSGALWDMGLVHNGICTRSQDIKLYSQIENILFSKYSQVSNIRRTLVGDSIVDYSDVVGASPVCAAPTTSSFSTWHLISIYCVKTIACRDEEHLSFGIWCTYIRDFTVLFIVFNPSGAITMMSHERHGISNYRQLDILFNCLFTLENKENNIKVLHYWFIVRGIHQWKV